MGLMGLFQDYQPIRDGYDEFFIKQNCPRKELNPFIEVFEHYHTLSSFAKNHHLAEQYLIDHNVTFNYEVAKVSLSKNSLSKSKDDAQNISPKNIFPVDLIPRIIFKDEWEVISKGLIQRVKALNLFLSDIYHEQKIIQQNIIPKELIQSGKGYLRKVHGITPPGNIYIHIAGIDLIRDDNGQFIVLEDNLRTPSGVSYVLENRNISKKLFPEFFEAESILQIEDYPSRLLSALTSLHQGSEHKKHEDKESQHKDGEGIMVLLTPGPFNSAYFEHEFLAKEMNCPLVQGGDLYVKDKKVYFKNKNEKKGKKEDKLVSLIYRRIDDNFLDPEVFNKNSLIGVPGLFKAYEAGNVVLANAPGNGIADDKAIYPYVPEMIRFYLKEDPILQQVPTFSCLEEETFKYVIRNIKEMVIKNTSFSGGEEVYIGKNLNDVKKHKLIQQITQNRRSYIAQPLVNFSFCPTFIESQFQPRRCDFRPYIIQGNEFYVMPGGLTRVALKENGYIVNSCQGGGSKDTWIIS